MHCENMFNALVIHRPRMSACTEYVANALRTCSNQLLRRSMKSDTAFITHTEISHQQKQLQPSRLAKM
jgi:hypothetical protein